MPKVLIKRGTRSQLNAAAGASGLNAGELYLITDEGKLAVGTSASAYIEAQAQDGDIDAIAALSGSSGLLKKTAANTWTLDTAAYSTTTGTVTTASVVSANGFAGTVANASTTPAITLTTSISGLLKGNGTAISAAAAGTDYLAPAAIGSTVQAYNANLTTWAGKTAPSGSVVGTTDTQTLSGKTLGSTKEAVYTITDGAAFEIDPANGGIQKITLGAGRTPKGTNFASGQSVRLKVAATSYTITWIDGTLNPTWLSPTDAAGSAPTLSATRTTIIDLWKDADGLYAAHVGYA